MKKSKHLFKLFFPRGKKAIEINQQVVVSILSIIFIVLLFIFIIRACSTIDEKNRQAIKSDLQEGIKSFTESLLPKYGSIKQAKFELPEGVDTVCFVDLNHSDSIKNSTLAKDYPLINNSLNTNDTKNIFLIQNKVVVDALEGGNICFNEYPYYLCIKTPDNILDIWFEGRARCTTLYIDWSIFPKNYKNFSLLNYSNLFLVQERNISNNIENWREILSVVPLTLFRENEKTYVFNYSVFYIPGNQEITKPQIKGLMDTYSTNKSYLFNTTYSSGSPLGYNVRLMQTNDNEYFSFWGNFSSLVMVDYNNRDAALIASLLAAYVNTPLVFVNETNLDFYKPIINGRKIFVVTHGDQRTDLATYRYIKSNSADYYEISDSLLGIEGSVPAFAKLYSTLNITS